MSESGHAILGELLRSRFEITQALPNHFCTDETGQEEVSPSHRFHLFLKGSLLYTIGKHTILLKAGDQTFVPAWQRRRWTLGEEKSCHVIFCAFTTPNHLTPAPVLFRRRPTAKEFITERKAFERLNDLHYNRPSSLGKRLRMEAELKVALARFFDVAEPQWTHTDSPEQDGIHPEIRRVLQWLSHNYTSPDALEVLYRNNNLTPNYFRGLFHEATGESPRSYINRLRLFRARHLLMETPAAVKEVAARAGFPDAIQFSRRYHEFWGHPPSKDKR
jgi:AraC-like DNA-binding protein